MARKLLANIKAGTFQTEHKQLQQNINDNQTKPLNDYGGTRQKTRPLHNWVCNQTEKRILCNHKYNISLLQFSKVPTVSFLSDNSCLAFIFPFPTQKSPRCTIINLCLFSKRTQTKTSPSFPKPPENYPP